MVPEVLRLSVCRHEKDWLYVPARQAHEGPATVYLSRLRPLQHKKKRLRHIQAQPR